jgi:hypothetical protein
MEAERASPMNITLSGPEYVPSLHGGNRGGGQGATRSQYPNLEASSESLIELSASAGASQEPAGLRPESQATTAVPSGMCLSPRITVFLADTVLSNRCGPYRLPNCDGSHLHEHRGTLRLCW